MMHLSLFGVDWNQFLHAFLAFLASYFGGKVGAQNGNGNGGKVGAQNGNGNGGGPKQ